MKTSLGRWVGLAAALAIFNLGALAGRGAELGAASPAAATAPRIIVARSGLTEADVANYRLRSARAEAAAHAKAAGASDKKTAWIVVGVVVVVGAVALAASGGHGGMGGGY